MMTKKQLKAEARKHRVWFDMPLGTITHKSKKDYNRQSNKSDCKKALAKYR